MGDTMTMRELAKLANVSVATVSKAFSGAEDISDETKEHIFALSRQYGCFGKFYKGKYQKKVIAVIFPELKSSYYTNYVEHLKHLIEEAGCIPVLAVDDFVQEKQAELIEYYCSYLKVDGIIVFSLASVLKKAYTTPIVALFHSADNKVDTVKVNREAAIYSAVKLLTELGHEHIVFLGEKLTGSRGQNYRKAMEELGKTPVLVESSHRFENAGADGVDQLLENHIPFTALFCAYDDLAFGAIKRLQQRGFRVPEDVSIISYDNVSTGEYAQIPLSTVDTNPYEMCLVTWELLQKKMKNPYFRSRQSIISEPELILRDSVAKPREENTNVEI